MPHITHLDSLLVALFVATFLLSYPIIVANSQYPSAELVSSDKLVCYNATLTTCHSNGIQHAIEVCHFTRADVVARCVLADAVGCYNLSAIEYLITHYELTPRETYSITPCWPIYDAALWRQTKTVMWLIQHFIKKPSEYDIADTAQGLDAGWAFGVFCVRDDIETVIWFVRMRDLDDAEIARCARISPLDGKVAAWAARFLAAN
jgi:hypothetical protein